MAIETFDYRALERFAESLLTAAGLPTDHAAAVATALVTANLRGIDTHGVVRLEPYVKHVESGGINSEPDIVLTRSGETTFQVDADDGPGQSVAVEAMEAVVDVAREKGSAVATVRNSNHFGTCGYYSRIAADAGCIGIAMTNSSPEIAPYGGIDPIFGTNPFAYSIPANEPFHLTLDVATSVASLGKIVIAEKEGRAIPDDWATDESGEPVTSSEDVHALRPFGRHKGYGLALLVDVLTGLLSGAGPSAAAGDLFDDFGQPQRVGHFLGAIDVDAFRDRSAFEADVSRMVEAIKESKTRAGVDEILVPGEIEYRTQRERASEGIPLESAVVETLRELASDYDVELPEPI